MLNPDVVLRVSLYRINMNWCGSTAFGKYGPLPTLPVRTSDGTVCPTPPWARCLVCDRYSAICYLLVLVVIRRWSPVAISHQERAPPSPQ